MATASDSQLRPGGSPPPRGFRTLQIVAGVLILVITGVVAWHRLHAGPVAGSAPPGQPGTPPGQTPPPSQPAPAPQPSPAGQDTSTRPQSIFDVPLDTAPAPAPAPKAPTPSTTAPAPPAPTPKAPATRPSTPAPVPYSKPGPVVPPERERPEPALAATGLLTFSDVKMVTVAGTKGHDQDVLLNFIGNEIAIVAKKGGSTLRSMPYSRVANATYTHADAPAWNRAASGPPPGFDVPHGLFDRGAHHWLVLQTRTDYLILRLDDRNWRDVLDTVRARVGVEVARRAAPVKRR